ncbi:acylphosphatase [Vibrio europaeus]|uniref:Acylphosphatase n=1 Tax=Vibrio europaeus TaxID=300876 RepID=A0A178JFB8_9VIBR|nr:acylphosphatase [Vibrio europaeus]MDC5706350.1 acylphosphatase [Vibrio europaeus]MDC5711665.1 acylphosphatase [Vibrio europaeus]MDC5716140.1 acylphosphatase [Vibrio europaeus]MDC5720896.1 acylphosphatase [Vibrio europaeus]MDC5723233.1 acylphosphatase [Vibrio europaeus]
MDQSCERFTVSGLVQGVGFRYHTSYKGLGLEATGYAKNLDNGDVEVVVCGSGLQVEAMAKWLEHGPRSARVDSVIRESIAYKPYKGFKIL